MQPPTAEAAVRGMGESLNANEFSGAATFSIPLPASGARDLTPDLSLEYSSFAGNGVFGIGFSLSLAHVGRRISTGVPRYRDDDTFVFDGEVLVAGSTTRAEQGTLLYDVVRYRPRVEGDFDRIERWVQQDSGEVFWKVTTTACVTTLYGRSEESRIADPSDPARVFEWWPELAYDAKGNAIRYRYKQENSENVPDAVYEAGRVQTANRYPERVVYGNVQPYRPGDEYRANEPDPMNWLFEIVFDYGEYDPSPTSDNPYVPVRPWGARPDSFSRYDSGFERRTHRLCRNVLLFHRFEEVAPVPVLVRRTRLEYDEGPDASCLRVAEAIGSRYQADAPAGLRYSAISLPPLRLGFSRFDPGELWHVLEGSGGGSLPGVAIEPMATIVDLYGDGLPGLLYASGPTVRFARPTLDVVGSIAYSSQPPALLPIARDSGSLTLVDLDGNGRADSIVTTAGRAGYYPNHHGRFGPFVPFASFPTELADHGQEYADLTGDGRADLVLVEREAVRYSPSLGTRGYAPNVRASRPAGLPLSTGPSGDEVLGFADIPGAGGESRVRVRDGSVECWPSLGYGRFGPMVTLGDAPHFPNFDPSRLRFVDVDGSGLNDLAYVFNDRVEVYRNLAGNRFATDPIVVQLPAGALSPEQVSFADLDGTGAQAVVFAELLPPSRQLVMCFVSRGAKPFLLTSVDNGLGARTTIHYESSTRFLLEDRRGGHPWVTTVPFPVQVVSEVETVDLISQARAVASYRYRHGYYDPVEREFRGFGMVERWDTDRVTALAPRGGPDVVAPSVTRMWFLTGAWEIEPEILARYRGEYFGGDPAAYDMPKSFFQWLAPEPSAAVQRQSRIALAGRPVRIEVYGHDGGEVQDVPYNVEAFNYTVRELPGSEHSPYAVFVATDRESISYDYERNADDPRVAHNFDLRFDAHANPERTASVAYRRRPGHSGTIEAQLRTWMTCEVSTYVPARDEPDVYLSGLPLEQRSLEMLDPPPPVAGGYYTFEQMVQVVDEALGGPGGPEVWLLGIDRRVYATEVVGSGEPLVTAQALLLREDQAAFDDVEVNALFASTPIASELAALLREKGGYRLEPDGYWWSPSATRGYAGPDHFYVATSVSDPFAAPAVAGRSGTVISYRYDRYDLAALEEQAAPSAADVLTTRTSVLDFDYQTLTARKVRDANGVASEVLQDALGRVIATSHAGEELHDGVAVRVGFAPLDSGEPWPQPASLDELVANPADYLRGAASFMYYDTTDPGPVSVTTLSAQEYPDLARADQPGGPVAVGIVYRDGLGRPVQETIRVEPGTGLAYDEDGQACRDERGAIQIVNLDDRWRSSGRVRFNDKGEPFRQFEPFFIGTYRFVPDEWLAEFGVSLTLGYDPLGRLERIDSPRAAFEDAFFSRIERHPWEETAWDEDDTVLESRYYRYHVDQGHPLPEPERTALLAAAQFANTPSTARVDALGHPVEEVARLATSTGIEELVTANEFLVTGEPTRTADPRLRERDAWNFDTVYSLAGNPLTTVSADAGREYYLVDVLGDPIATVDPRGFVVMPDYDSRQRITTMVVATPGVSAPVPGPVGSEPGLPGRRYVARRAVYGDSLDHEAETVVPVAAHNVVGRPVVVYDEAGGGRTLSYTIDGQPRSGEQRLLASYQVPGDWGGEDGTWAALFAHLDRQLASETFSTSYRYDALGRAKERTDPVGNRWLESYHVSGLLSGVSIAPPGGVSRRYVGAISYNPKGEREQVEYRDPDGALLLTTTYLYDRFDFRLTGLRTVRASDGATLQDSAYWYDPVGNLMLVTDRAAPAQRTVRAQQVVTPDRSFGYDSLYRLVNSTGRAHMALNRADLRTGSYAPFFAPPPEHANDATAVQNYRMSYDYHGANNLSRLRYATATTQWAQTLTVAEHSNRAVEDDAGGTIADAFDAAGNPRFLAALPALRWDYRNTLQAATIVDRGDREPDAVFYTYRASGERVRKVVRTLTGGGVQTDQTIYLGPFEINRLTRGDAEAVVSEYVRLRVMDGGRCAVQWLQWTVGTPPKDGSPDEHRYQLDDRLGSSVMEVDAQGRVISYEEYAPYGGTTYASGESLAEVSRKHYRFSGKQRDAESGLSYFGARYYAPWLGRWINPDPVGPVDGLNLYEYVGSNPVAYIDPLGLAKKKKKKAPDPKVLKARRRATKLFGRGRAKFYPVLRNLARLARSGDATAIASAKRLAARMENDPAFKKEVGKRVRVRAKKAGGAKKGYGKDELFQTSETAFAFKVSAGLVPGMAATALFKGPSGAVQEVDLLDAQEHIRLDTSIVPTKQGEGHTGMLRATKSSSGYMTTGQAQFHQDRTTVMTTASSTGEAILNVVASHIHATANVATMQAKHTSGFTVTNQDLSKTTHQNAFVQQQAKVRDQNKMVVDELKTRLYEPGGTTLVAFTQPPLSPRHDPTYSSTSFTKAQGIDEFGSFFAFALPTFASTNK